MVKCYAFTHGYLAEVTQPVGEVAGSRQGRLVG